MLQFPRDAPGSDACNRSGMPLLAICPNKHRRLIPFQLLKTVQDDGTPLYGRPFSAHAAEVGRPSHGADDPSTARHRRRSALMQDPREALECQLGASTREFIAERR